MSHSLLSFISMNYSQKNKTKQKTKNKKQNIPSQQNKLKTLPVGLEPTTVRLKAARSTD